MSYLAHLVGDQDQFDKFLKVQSTLHEGEKDKEQIKCWARVQG